VPDLNEPTNDNKNEKNEDPNKIVTKSLEKAKDSLLDNGNEKNVKSYSKKEKLVTKKSENAKKKIQKNRNIRIISKNKRAIRNAQKKYLLKLNKGNAAASNKRLAYTRSKTKRQQINQRNFRRLSNKKDQQTYKTAGRQSYGSSTKRKDQNRNRQRRIQRLKNQKRKEATLSKEQVKLLSRKKATTDINGSRITTKNKRENLQEKPLTKKAASLKKDKVNPKKENKKKEIKKGKRKNGKKKLISKKKLFGKKDIKQNMFNKMTGKVGAKGKAQQMIIDKFGRDDKGNLNMVGLILTVIFLVLSIQVLTVLAVLVTILVVVIAVVAVIMTVWSFILALFTLKTEDMALTEAYEYVTYLDAYKNRDIYNRYNQLVEEYDKVYFEVNGIEADPKSFSFTSNADNYVYYLNAKYENYDIQKSALADYLKRLKEHTGVAAPSFVSIYAGFKDSKQPMDGEPVKITKVRDEIHAIHDATFTYNLKVEDKVATMDVKIQTLGELLDFDPQIEIYARDKVIGTIPAFSDDEVDQYYPILEIDRFESKIFMNNPLGQDRYASVTSQFGYRGKDDANVNNEIIIAAEPGTPVYATTTEKVVDILSYTARDRNGKEQTTRSIKTETASYQPYYINVTPTVRVGEKLKEGDLIGYTRDEFDGNLLMAIKERRVFIYRNPEIVPVVFIDKLTYADRTKFGYYESSQLQGELLYPPEKVSKWKEKVELETKKYNILSYTNTILSIIWVESGGDEEKLSDIMGISKAKGSTNTVSPAESIEQGVEYFAQLLKKSQINQVGDLAAVQAYSYGEAYLDDLIRLNSRYSFDHSRLYAKEKSKGQTTSCNDAAALDLGFNWRYTFGDMFYARKVSYNLSKDLNKMIQVAKEEIGTPNGDKYWQWAGFDNRVEWSALFVGWVADQAGYIDAGRVLKTSSPLDMMEWFKTHKKFVAPEEKYIPQPGDLIFFDWKGEKTGKDQVGIVEFSSGSIIQVIEGNSSNLVRRNTYTIDNPAISGYGTP
jgi:murein DD-endopeptidase MepM/ murein hydrolase activator NlpD